MVKLGINHLIDFENKAIDDTHINLHGFYENCPIIIDTMLKLHYYTGKFESSETNLGAFQSFCYTSYVQDPLTFWSIFRLYERGCYLEACILLRHLLESFVQMKYLAKHPEKTLDFFNLNKRINFRKVFDEFAPEFYNKSYGKMLSTYTHRLLGKDIFRFKRKSPSEGRQIEPYTYNEKFATFVINFKIPLIYGYLHNFDMFFINNTISEDKDFEKILNRNKKWLDDAMESHIKNYPDTEDWYKDYFKIIGKEKK